MDKQRQRVKKKIEDVKRVKAPKIDYLMQGKQLIYSERNLLLKGLVLIIEFKTMAVFRKFMKNTSCICTQNM